MYTKLKGQNNGARYETGSNVRYDRSGNVIMTISRREQHPSYNYQLDDYGRATQSPIQLYPPPPPPYSEVTGGKNQSVSPPEQQGQTNLAIVSDGEAPLQGMPLPEAPPAYESVPSTAY